MRRFILCFLLTYIIVFSPNVIKAENFQSQNRLIEIVKLQKVLRNYMSENKEKMMIEKEKEHLIKNEVPKESIKEDKVVYLTFDDGPSENTVKLPTTYRSGGFCFIGYALNL